MKYNNLNNRIKNQQLKEERIQNHRLWVKTLTLILLTEIVDLELGKELGFSS